MGLFDLIFIALILWWIFRALGGARGRREGGGREAPPAERPPGGRMPGQRAPGGQAPRQRPPGASAGSGEPEWRRRLKEAVREWELEQRRRAGEPVPHPYGIPEAEERERSAAAPTRMEAPPRPLEAEAPERPSPRARPPPARGGPAPFPEPRPRPTPPSPPRRRPRGRPPEAGPSAGRPSSGDGRRRREPAMAAGAPDLGPQIGARGEAGDLAAAGERPGARPARPSGHRGLELPALRGLSELQRAIVYQDILGPPRAAAPPAHDSWF